MDNKDKHSQVLYTKEEMNKLARAMVVLVISAMFFSFVLGYVVGRLLR